jgi:transcriptional regulator with XRE-family HTH domain
MPCAGEKDKHIGIKIAFRRIELGLTQMQLAARIGISYQQLHKNEIGKNRVSASRLYDIAKALEISDINYFYQGIDQKPKLHLVRSTNTSSKRRRIIGDKI